MPALFAKINPPAQIPNMESPFNYDVITADYLTAIANPYILGSTSVNFNLAYGTATFTSGGTMETWKTQLTGYVTLSGAEIQNWGIDDTVVLTEICEKVGTTPVEFVTGSPKGFNP